MSPNFSVLVPCHKVWPSEVGLAAEIEGVEERMAMEDPQAMAVDPDHDEAYVSGKLSSGFPSIGENSPSGTLSLNTEAAGERRKAGGKGKDGVRKSVSPQPGHRRKHAHPSRHGGGSHGEVSLGSAFSLPKTPSGSLPTPTTQLSQQINQMGLMSPLVSGGKRRLAERPDDMSPMSDTEGGSHSLTDPGYDSLPLGPSSLEHPNSLLKERGRTGGGGDGQQKKDTTVAIKPAGILILLWIVSVINFDELCCCVWLMTAFCIHCTTKAFSYNNTVWI